MKIPMSRSLLFVGFVFAVGLIAGCRDRGKDKAEPWYTRCLELEGKGELGRAEDACNAAIAADPKSKSGMAAAAKLKEIGPDIEAHRKAANEVATERIKEAAAARQADADSLRAKVSRQRWGVMDDSCAAKGRPPKCYRYSGGTTNQNEAVATADGCVTQGQGYVDFYFCCPK